MEGLTLIIVMMSSFIMGGKGQQISTPCTSSMISTFTPCFNFITGSSGGSVTPSAGCCDSLKALTKTGKDCACLILTANVPLPTSFINRTLSLALPRACKMDGVPIQCQAAGAPLPAPGPVPFLLAPPPPVSALSPGSSKAAATTPAPEPEPATDVPVDGPVSTTSKQGGIRPVVQPTSFAQNSTSPFLSLLFFLFFLLIL